MKTPLETIANPGRHRRWRDVPGRKYIEAGAGILLLFLVLGERAPTFLFLAALLALAGLAVAFVAALAVRLFTKRRPPLWTRRADAIAAIAIIVIVVGMAGCCADDLRHDALFAAAEGLVGADKEAVERRLGPPEKRFPAEEAPTRLTFPLGDHAAARAVEIWTYRAGVWFSWYQPSVRLVVCFDDLNRCFEYSAED